MANPAAPFEANGDKIAFMTEDLGGGVNGPALPVAHKGRVQNGSRVADLVVYPMSGDLLAFGYTLVGTSTPEQTVGGATPCQGVRIRASSGNSGVVYVGGATVTDDEGTATSGYPLAAGEAVDVPCRDAADVWITGTAGDMVAVIASAD